MDRRVSGLRSTMGDFGDKFRKARESKELSLDDVSRVTKIAPRMLRAIEEEHFDQLPGGVFNKGFIRSYAKQLGLDPEESVSEYLESVRKTQVATIQSWEAEQQALQAPAGKPAPAANTKNANTKKKIAAKSEPPVQVEELPDLHMPRAEDVRPKRRAIPGGGSSEIPWRLIVAGAAVVVLTGVLWTRHSHNVHTNAARIAPTSAPTSPATPTTTRSASSQPQSSSPNPQPGSPAAAPMATNNQPASGKDAAAGNNEDDKNDVTVRNFGQPLPKSTTTTTVGALTLVIRASETSWISVISDGQPATEVTLIAPASETFHASRQFIVKVGNAGGVSFLLNGKEIQPQGNEGDVRTLTFDSNGLTPPP